MEPRIKLLSAEIYEAIWTDSVKQAAKEYKVNYEDLLVACHQAGIPIPNTKYRMALKNGQDTTKLRVALPMNVDKYILVKAVKTSGVTQGDKLQFDPDDIKQQFSFLDDSVKIQQITDALIKASQRKSWQTSPEVKAYKASVKQWRTDKHPRSRNYYYNEDKPQSPKFIDNLSPRGLQRACRILNRVVTVFKQVGERVTDDLAITIGQDEVEYEIKEDRDKIPHKLTSQEKQELAHYEEEKKRYDWASRPQIRKYDRPYNGHLRIRFIVAGSHKRYVKDDKAPLEDQLLSIIVAFYKTYLETKHKREQWEAEERARKLEEQRDQRRKQRIADEKQRVLTLINEAKDYQLANAVRRYVTALEDEDGDKVKIAWMKSVADWIDPLVSGENPYLKKRQHGDSDEKKANYLGEETASHHDSFMNYLNML